MHSLLRSERIFFLNLNSEINMFVQIPIEETQSSRIKKQDFSLYSAPVLLCSL